MPIPAGITSITVTGTFVDASGVPLAGYVLFTPSITAADPTDNAIVPMAPVRANLDTNGAISVALAATDDTTWAVPGWTYSVKVHLNTANVADRTYNIEVPAASAGGTLDLADAIEVDNPGVSTPFLLRTGGTMTGDLVLSGSGTDLTVGGNASVAGTATVTGRMTLTERLSMSGFLTPFGARDSRIPFRTNASFMQIFNSGHGWTFSGSATSTDDTTEYLRGSQSVKTITNGAGGSSFVRKTGLTSMDLTGKAIRLVFKVQDVAHLRTAQAIRLRIASDSSFVNGYVFDVYAPSGAANAQVQSNEWTVWTVSWSSVANPSGTYTLTNGVPSSKTGFTAFSVEMFDDSAGAITWWLDSIEVIPDETVTPFPTGVISLCFDDTWASPYTYAKPKMDSLGYRGTFYTIAENVGVSQYMTLAQLKTLHSLGHEIAGHAYTSANHNATNGFSSLTADTVDYDMVRMKLWLEQNGFTSDNFAYPKGHFEATTDGTYVSEIARRYFKTSRSIGGGAYETQRPAQPQRLRALTAINDGVALGGRTVASLTAAGAELDRIAASGGWSIWTFHEIITTTPTDSARISQTGFNTLMDAIAAKNIAVRPVGEVIDYYGFGGES